jgi:uncharacterized repeat protein (TIGR03843 family)
MQEEGGYDAVIERLSVFDVIANNADRKSGHCLKASDGRLWAIDHGICFHAEPKLRTVIWDFAGSPIDPAIMNDLRALQERVQQRDPLIEALEQLLAPDEVQAFHRRLERLIRRGKHPEPGRGHNVPWPPV